MQNNRMAYSILLMGCIHSSLWSIGCNLLSSGVTKTQMFWAWETYVVNIFTCYKYHLVSGTFDTWNWYIDARHDTHSRTTYGAAIVEGRRVKVYYMPLTYTRNVEDSIECHSDQIRQQTSYDWGNHPSSTATTHSFCPSGVKLEIYQRNKKSSASGVR